MLKMVKTHTVNTTAHTAARLRFIAAHREEQRQRVTGERHKANNTNDNNQKRKKREIARKQNDRAE